VKIHSTDAGHSNADGGEYNMYKGSMLEVIFTVEGYAVKSKV
jgi:hypothetical protein